MINSIKLYNPNFYGKNNKQIKKQKKEAMSSDFYEQANTDFDKENALKVVSQRIKSMPQLMDSLFGTISWYLQGLTSRNNFIEIYQDEAVPFYKRLHTGVNKEEYAQNYAPEIETLKDISASTEKYKKADYTAKELDAEIENSVDKYVNTEINRKVNFII